MSRDIMIKRMTMQKGLVKASVIETDHVASKVHRGKSRKAVHGVATGTVQLKAELRA